MPGLEPGIHVFLPTASNKVVDGRDEPGEAIAAVMATQSDKK
jgi:hypothetical protein